MFIRTLVLLLSFLFCVSCSTTKNSTKKYKKTQLQQEYEYRLYWNIYWYQQRYYR